jgi:hypothetical protein
MDMQVDPNAGTPLTQGTLNTSAAANIFSLGKPVGGLIDLYRYNHDHTQAMGEAADKLKYQPNGSAVIVTESGTKWGDRNFGGVHYDGTSVGRAQSIDSAIDEINGPHLNAPNDVSHSYIVYKDDACPADTHGVYAVSVEDANSMR